MYSLSEEVLNETLKYLATRPYSEVFQLISVIQSSAKKLDEPKAKKEKK